MSQEKSPKNGQRWIDIVYSSRNGKTLVYVAQLWGDKTWQRRFKRVEGSPKHQ